MSPLATGAEHRVKRCTPVLIGCGVTLTDRWSKEASWVSERRSEANDRRRCVLILCGFFRWWYPCWLCAHIQQVMVWAAGMRHALKQKGDSYHHYYISSRWWYGLRGWGMLWNRKVTHIIIITDLQVVMVWAAGMRHALKQKGDSYHHYYISSRWWYGLRGWGMLWNRKVTHIIIITYPADGGMDCGDEACSETERWLISSFLHIQVVVWTAGMRHALKQKGDSYHHFYISSRWWCGLREWGML